MSHTTFVETEEHGRVAVIHNGDWSGDAEIVIGAEGKGRTAVVVPCDVLLAVGREAARQVLAERIATALDEPLGFAGRTKP